MGHGATAIVAKRVPETVHRRLVIEALEPGEPAVEPQLRIAGDGGDGPAVAAEIVIAARRHEVARAASQARQICRSFWRSKLGSWPAWTTVTGSCRSRSMVRA